jgi:group I intron endonuclease
MAYGIVYRLTDTVSGLSYYGQTCGTLSRRWACHVSAAKRSRSPLSQAIREHGREAFLVERICDAPDLPTLNALEIFWIGVNSPDCLNRALGGIGGGKHSEETKALKRESGLRRFQRPGEREKQGERSRAQWSRPEVKAKASKSLRAAWTDERRAAYSQRCLGRDWRSPEGQERTRMARCLPVAVVKDNGDEVVFESCSAAARTLGLCISAVSNCLSGKRHSHKGFTFRRMEVQ